MRTIEVAKITEAVAKMCMDACYYLSDDVYKALKSAQETEESPLGRDVIAQIVKNADIAREESVPICQDTGMTVIFLELGQDAHIVGGDLTEAINAGVAKGYTEGYLRKSVVEEPLFNRKNTTNNTPAVIHTTIVPGDKLKIKLAPKGFGSENKSGMKILVPADGVEWNGVAVFDFKPFCLIWTGLINDAGRRRTPILGQKSDQVGVFRHGNCFRLELGAAKIGVVEQI